VPAGGLIGVVFNRDGGDFTPGPRRIKSAFLAGDSAFAIFPQLACHDPRL
jgi:hypothetical protein